MYLAPSIFDMELFKSPVVILLAVGLMVMMMAVPIVWLGLRHAWKSRQMLHQERLKALELGQPVALANESEKPEEPSSRSNRFWIAFWIGAVVPMTTVMSAGASVSSDAVTSHSNFLGICLAVWIPVAVICIASVISAAVVITRDPRD